MAKDRRTSARQRMILELYGRTVPLGIPITLIDISLTGMAIRTQLPLPVDASQRFELRLKDGSCVRLDGDVMHCEALNDNEFIVGVRFHECTPVADLFDRITVGVSELNEAPEPAVSGKTR